MRAENIKFKAKELGTGKWKEGSLQKDMDYNLCILIANKEDHSWYWTQIDSDTICQFTGARDCDGTPIYEHDLLRSKTGSIYEVVWNQGNTSFSLVNTEYPVLYSTNSLGRMLHNRQLKVVGNKFDKKEVV